MNYAVILAGGKGSRFKGDIPKQFIEMTGHPMIYYSLKSANENTNIDIICVVSPLSYHEQIRQWVKKYDILKPVLYAESGKERYESVYNGLLAIPAVSRDTVLIMTAVCPFVSQRTLNKLYRAIESYDACITTVKATDAITFSNNGKVVNRTLQKKKLFIQQGPQIYKYGILMLAHNSYRQDENRIEVNEDSELVLNLGVECGMIMGDRFCLKVTFPEDLAIVEAIFPLFVAQENKVRQNLNEGEWE